jgi:ATP-dependent DNA ligase
VNLHPQFDDIQLHLFDIVDLNLPQWQRLRKLTELSEGFRPGLVEVVTRVAEDLDGILRIYDEFISLGYEGIIVRHIDGPYVRRRSTFIMKFKPKKSDIYQIVGVKQMIDKDGNPKEMLGALICQAQDTPETFGVGSGMDDEFRRAHWPEDKAEELVGKSLLVEYQHITPGVGVPRFPVFVKILEKQGGFVNPLL